MYRLQLTLLLLFFSAAVWAQEAEAEPDASDPAPEEAAETEGDVSDEDIDELLGLDGDYTEAEDDDFDPTENVRFEQSIPFPVDI